MPDAIDRLVEQWGELNIAYVHDLRDTPEETKATFAAAQRALDRSVTEIAELIRAGRQQPIGERAAHALRIRRARKSLAEARRMVQVAHRLVTAAREARDRGALLRQENVRRLARIGHKTRR
jgi:hypothetical protein